MLAANCCTPRLLTVSAFEKLRYGRILGDDAASSADAAMAANPLYDTQPLDRTDGRALDLRHVASSPRSASPAILSAPSRTAPGRTGNKRTRRKQRCYTRPNLRGRNQDRDWDQHRIIETEATSRPVVWPRDRPRPNFGLQVDVETKILPSSWSVDVRSRDWDWDADQTLAM